MMRIIARRMNAEVDCGSVRSRGRGAFRSVVDLQASINRPQRDKSDAKALHLDGRSQLIIAAVKRGTKC